MLLACGNGASEMLSSVSGSITGILYNLQLMKYAGEDGVAAYGVVMRRSSSSAYSTATRRAAPRSWAITTAHRITGRCGTF